MPDPQSSQRPPPQPARLSPAGWTMAGLGILFGLGVTVLVSEHAGWPDLGANTSQTLSDVVLGLGAVLVLASFALGEKGDGAPGAPDDGRPMGENQAEAPADSTTGAPATPPLARAPEPPVPPSERLVERTEPRTAAVVGSMQATAARMQRRAGAMVAGLVVVVGLGCAGVLFAGQLIATETTVPDLAVGTQPSAAGIGTGTPAAAHTASAERGVLVATTITRLAILGVVAVLALALLRTYRQTLAIAADFEGRAQLVAFTGADMAAVEQASGLFARTQPPRAASQAPAPRQPASVGETAKDLAP